MNLPGLNFDETVYSLTWRGSVKFREIPFSDWLPPDHQDVICYGNGKVFEAYFSPLSGLMVPSDSSTAHCAFEPFELDYWLKEVK
ncbi:hypothetical protein [Enterobacter phage Phc]|nr:hypothetical protein [Enterobacter phage Phc]